jgi:hypothetical protein
MIYSVYDHYTRQWDYYEGAGSVPTTAFFRDSGQGSSPERLLASLPEDAVLVGRGALPRGVVASDPGSRAWLAGVGLGQAAAPPSSSLSWIGLAFVVGLSFWLGRKSVSVEKRVRSALS